MHFVHIIEINDPREPSIAPLTRKKLWDGLVRRAERPTAFLPQLHGCMIVMRGDATLVRELDFGSFTVRDRVRLEPMKRLSFETEPSANSPAGRLVVEIEEPSTARLLLRFTYDVKRARSADVEAEQRYDQMVQLAYRQTDIESIRIIRGLVDRGEI